VRARTGRELGLAHLTRFLARGIRRWHEIPVEGPDGAPVYIDLRAKEGYFNGGFGNTAEHMTALMPFVRDNDVVVDIGANIGVWSRVILSSRKLSQLVAFEPGGRNFELLRKNLGENPESSCLPFAVGASCGVAEFSTHLDSGQNYLLPIEVGSAARRSRTVKMVTLDSWWAGSGMERLDLLKVDVEGFEFDVFLGAEAVLRDQSPIVYFEFIPSSAVRGSRGNKSLEFLISLGYEIRAVTLRGQLVKTDSKLELSNDYIAFPRHRVGELSQGTIDRTGTLT
jgi:FkbM family methyltransferase